MPRLSPSDLDKLYQEAESADKSVFSEMRSNLLLVAGEHYNKRKRRQFINRLRDTKAISEDQKLRLTKNHIGRISNLYVNNIVSGSPGVKITPDVDTEVQDQKAAELHGAVWECAKEKYRLSEKIRDFAQDFVEIGECWAKIIWDPSKGEFKGYNQLVDEFGNPVFDEMGQPAPDVNSPVFTGEFNIERVYGFDLLRDPSVKEMEESEYLIQRKMVELKGLKFRYAKDPEKLKLLDETEDETFVIFDNNSKDYSATKDKILIREFYWKPSPRYPQGYFCITTKSGILEQGELPFGIWPFVGKQFDKFQKSPRGHSKIKQLRPYQIEINRCASQISYHQAVLGDDKLVGSVMGKVEHGGILPGIRFIKTNSAGDLKVLPGRSGEQYLGYMQQQISEMYDVANLREEAEEKSTVSDPYLNLFKSLKQRKRFSIYVEKFEEFLTSLCTTYLKLAKVYLPDDMVIYAIGKKEAINIAEFRSMEPVGYRIDVEPRNDDLDTLFGRQLTMNHLLQYAGAQLSSEDIGKIIKNMPFANMDESFSDLTIDYENAKNDVLALERGQYPPTRRHENHEYHIKKLVHRMKKADFPMLHPQIQQAFQMKLQEHEMAYKQQLEYIKMLESELIPTGGYHVKVDFYTTNKEGKTRRATLPYESVRWLIEKLAAQGATQEDLEKMQMSARADVSAMAVQGQPNPQPGQPTR